MCLAVSRCALCALLVLLCHALAQGSTADDLAAEMDADVVLEQQQLSGKAALQARSLEAQSDLELGALLRALVARLEDDLNCLAVMSDPLHQSLFGPAFYRRLGLVPVFKVLVKVNEDLLSPNYRTLQVIRQVRKQGCGAYVLLFANGIQLARLLRFGDAHRVLDTRARFVVLYDRRVLSPDLHYLWKKIVNVVFVRRYGGPWAAGAGRRASTWFELSTVPFPAPIRGVLVPRRLDTWRRGSFRQGADLFRDKTSDLQNQTLPVVTFSHVPASYKLTANQMARQGAGDTAGGFGGLEVQVMLALARAMNFAPRLYEPPNAAREQWGRRQLDGSLSGILGEAQAGRAELVLGDLHYSPYHLELLDLSVPYHVECLTFLTPEATTDNSWQTLILSFSPGMWLAVGLTLALGGVVFYLLARAHAHIEEHMNDSFDLPVDKPAPAPPTETREDQPQAGAEGHSQTNKDGATRRRHLAALAAMAGGGLRRLSQRIPRPHLQLPRLPHLPQLPARLRHLPRPQLPAWLVRFGNAKQTEFEPVLEEETATQDAGGRPRELTPKVDTSYVPMSESEKTALHLFSESLGSAMLYTSGMLLGISLPRIPSGWALRVMVGWWWLYAILVVVAYRASMTAILANPAPKITIDSLEQLADSALSVGGWGEHVKDFFQTSLDAAGQKVGSKFEVTEDSEVSVERVAQGSFAYYENSHFLRFAAARRRQKVRSRTLKDNNQLSTQSNTTNEDSKVNVNVGASIGEEHAANIGNSAIGNGDNLGNTAGPSATNTDSSTARALDANGTSGLVGNDSNTGETHSTPPALQERNLHIMRDCVINMPISLGLQKNSALKPRVDKFLRRVIEAGLVHKWLTDAMLATTGDGAGVLLDEEAVKALMELKKLYGALVALGVGLGLAALTLIGEVVFYRVVVVRKPTFDVYAKNRGLADTQWHKKPF